MAYSKKGLEILIKNVQEIDRQHYEPYHDSCHKMVWRKYIYPVFGISYRTFLRYLKIRLPED